MSSVSIIIPVYNTERYLEKCLDSVVNQSLKDIEIIVINDGSKDGSKDIIEKFKKLDERIVFIDKENGGQSAARNEGVKIARGEYIAFVDSDDWVEKDMYKDLYEAAVKSNADVAICDHNYIYDNREKNRFNIYNMKNETIDMENYGVDNYIMNYIKTYKHGNEVWSRIYKRNILEENHIAFDINSQKGIPEIGEDLLFNLKVALHCNKVVSIDKAYYNYYIREGSSMNSHKPDLLKRSINIVKIFLEEIKKNHRDDRFNLLIFRLLLTSIKEEYIRCYEEGRSKEYMEEWKSIKDDKFIKDYLFIKDPRISQKDKIYRVLTYNNQFFIVKLMHNLKKSK